jgi:PadR family transcriptional regulator
MGSTVPPVAEGRTLDRDAARFGRNAEPFILLILHEGRSYGYEIRTRLEAFGFRRAAREPGVVYRLLRSLEEAGLIESEWDVAGTGPARRYYRLTEVGREQLRHGAEHLERQARRIQEFFELYRQTQAANGEA